MRALRTLLRRAVRQRRSRRTATGAPGRLWLFDLDNTLHDTSHAIFPQIDHGMTMAAVSYTHLVAAWLAGYEQVGLMIDDITGFLNRWLPQYTQDTRNYLTVAIGCTGGQHRSVYVVEQLAKRFADHDPLLVRHRTQLPDESA